MKCVVLRALGIRDDERIDAAEMEDRDPEADREVVQVDQKQALRHHERVRAHLPVRLEPDHVDARYCMAKSR